MGVDRRQLTRFGRMSLKELRETMRDRRTIVTLVLMPILVYPLMSIVFQKFLFTNMKQSVERVFHVGIESEREYLVVNQLFLLADELRNENVQTEREEGIVHVKSLIFSDEENSLTFPAEAAGKTSTKFVFYRFDILEEAIDSQDVDIGLRIEVKDRFRVAGRTIPLIDAEIVYSPRSLNSQDGYEELAQRLADVNMILLPLREKDLALSRRVVPLSIARKEISLNGGGQSLPSVSLSTLVPMILILMTMTGAVYPAIDLTAGERERGTLEAVIATPVSRFSLLLAKYVAVLTVAMMTASLNVASMTVTLISSGLGRLLFGERGLQLAVIAGVFGLILLFAMFFSAVLLTVTSFARSFKEAQAYLIPLMLVSLTPGMLSLMPDLKLSGGMALIPLVNCILLARDLFSESADLGSAVIVVSVTVLYACVALIFAGRVFGADSWQSGSPGTWKELLKGSSPNERLLPSWNHALLSLAVIVPAYLLSTQMTSQLENLSITVRLIVNSCLTIALFLLWPWLMTAIFRMSFRQTFRIAPCRIGDLVAALLLGLSVWPLAFEITIWVREWGAVGFQTEMLELYRDMIARWKQVSPLSILLLLAIIPAICEEIFFRGYLMSALSEKDTPTQTVLFSAILFGLFHLIVTDFLAWERLVPSTLLGCLLGWVRCKTRSLFPGILLHAVHNGTLLMLAYYHQNLQQRGWDLAGETHLPIAISLLAAAIVFTTIAALHRRGRPAIELNT